MSRLLRNPMTPRPDRDSTTPGHYDDDRQWSEQMADEEMSVAGEPISRSYEAALNLLYKVASREQAAHAKAHPEDPLGYKLRRSDKWRRCSALKFKFEDMQIRRTGRRLP